MKDVLKVTGNAYETLYGLVTAKDANLEGLQGMARCVDKDGNTAWVKRSNQDAWKGSSGSARAKEQTRIAENQRTRKLQEGLNNGSISVVAMTYEQEQAAKAQHLRVLSSEAGLLEQQLKQGHQVQAVIITEVEEANHEIEEAEKEIEAAKKKAQEKKDRAEAKKRKLLDEGAKADDERVVEALKEKLDAIALEQQEAKQLELDHKREEQEARKKKLKEEQRKVHETAQRQAEIEKRLEKAADTANTAKERTVKILTELITHVEGGADIPRLFLLVPKKSVDAEVKNAEIEEEHKRNQAAHKIESPLLNQIGELEKDRDDAKREAAEAKRSVFSMCKSPSSAVQERQYTKAKSAPIKDTLEKWMGKDEDSVYYLVFICAFDGSPAKCGPKGLGFEIDLKEKKNHAFLAQLQPALRLSMMLLRTVDMLQSIVTGIGLENALAGVVGDVGKFGSTLKMDKLESFQSLHSLNLNPGVAGAGLAVAGGAAMAGRAAVVSIGSKVAGKVSTEATSAANNAAEDFDAKDALDQGESAKQQLDEKKAQDDAFKRLQQDVTTAVDGNGTAVTTADDQECIKRLSGAAVGFRQ